MAADFAAAPNKAEFLRKHGVSRATIGRWTTSAAKARRKPGRPARRHHAPAPAPAPAPEPSAISDQPMLVFLGSVDGMLIAALVDAPAPMARFARQHSALGAAAI